MSSIERPQERRVTLTSPYPRDSRFYAQLSPTEWSRIIDITYSLEAFKSIPLLTGEMGRQDINKVHNILAALAFGKEHVPFILSLEANRERTGWDRVSMILDPHYDHQEQGETELLERPFFHQLAADPVNNVMQLRGIAREILNRQQISATQNGGVRIVPSDEVNGCFPRTIAIAGTKWSSIAVGRLIRGSYPLVLSTK